MRDCWFRMSTYFTGTCLNRSILKASLRLSLTSNKTLSIRENTNLVFTLNSSLRFSAEQFLYEGEEVVDNLSLNSSTTWNKESLMK